MKNYKIFFLFMISIVAVAGLYLILLNINTSHDKWVLSRKKMYCYETYHGPVNPVLFVEDTQYIDSLKKYYQSVENGNMRPVFNFPPLLVPTDTCVYILDYNKDSSIAKVQFYMIYKQRHITSVGYVYTHTLHTKKRIWAHHFLNGQIKY